MVLPFSRIKSPLQLVHRQNILFDNSRLEKLIQNRPKKTMSDNAPIIVRYSSSKPVDKCDSLSTLRHSIECIRQIPNDNSKPFLRACGCAHRFSPTRNGNQKSLSSYRRSKSCTPIQKQVKNETEEIKIKSEKPENLRRHISENNLYIKHTMEISETLEFVPQVNAKTELISRYEHRMVPKKYSTTIFIDKNSSEKRYIQQLFLEVCPTDVKSENLTTKKYINTIETTVKQTLSTNKDLSFT